MTHSTWMRVAAGIMALFMEFTSISASAATLPPGCEDLVKATEKTTGERIQANVPLIDPAKILSQVSCIDKILSFRLNIGSWFSIDGILNALYETLLNKACNAAESSWNNVLNRISTNTNVNITLPYGAGGASVGQGYEGGAAKSALALPNGKTSSGNSQGGIVDGMRAFWARIWGS